MNTQCPLNCIGGWTYREPHRTEHGPRRAICGHCHDARHDGSQWAQPLCDKRRLSREGAALFGQLLALATPPPRRERSCRAPRHPHDKTNHTKRERRREQKRRRAQKRRGR